ncbi:MAG TPA: hypothetical protein PK251_15690 [Candidatus Latescibacteria bacterium]|nr:hypothetical protein [Candidatus Latescibacterota bacterium]
MKKLFFFIAFFLFTGTAMAAPFVVSDPYTSGTIPDGFLVSVDGAAVVESAAVASALRFDIGGVSSGEHTLTIRAYKDDSAWGRLESTPVNFTFTRPAAPVGPSGIRLAP